VLVDAGGGERAPAGAGGDLTALEVADLRLKDRTSASATSSRAGHAGQARRLPTARDYPDRSFVTTVR